MDELMRMRECGLDRRGDVSSAYQRQLDGVEYSRVGITLTSHRATLTEASTTESFTESSPMPSGWCRVIHRRL